jgi:tRNA(adenine34) deaminase
MEQALGEARAAAAADEAPVGAVVVCDGVLVARGCNRVEELGDATAHAELEALRAAARELERRRLSGCTLYVTLEPCAMCLGACYLARIDRLVYGTSSPKFGALGSVVELGGVEGLNHRLVITGGVLAEAAEELLKAFFRRLRGTER